MILRELFEARAKAKSVGIIFGRFNPPHMGHIKAWEMASENPAWYVGTNKDTQGPKDPLPYSVKIEVMKTMYPDLEGHLVSEISWLTLASKVYEKHGNIVLNVYTDEDWVTKTLVQYNGKEGQHGYYEFGTIQQQVTPRLSSATALRAAVMADNRDAFSRAAGVDADTLIAGHAFFDVVKHYLMPHAAKAAAKPVKKKVKEPVDEISGELRNRYVTRASDDYGSANFAARASKSHPGLDDYSKEQERRAEKRRAGLNRALSDRRLGKDVAENKLGHKLAWPEVVNKINSAMKATGWKGKRQGDDAFMFSTKGQETDDQWYIVMIENAGDGYFSYALGTVEDGDPHIDDAYRGKLPNTEASVSELINDIRDGFGLDENVAENAWDRLQREKALESAGVGIITKQNSTVDVNKNTPKKNLKAFRLI